MSYQINKFGKTGIIFGFIAFGLALLPFWTGPVGSPESAFNIDDAIRTGSLVLALTAIVLAVVSFLHNENIRLSSVAATIGGVTLAFHFILAAIGIVIFLAVIAFIISNSKKQH